MDKPRISFWARKKFKKYANIKVIECDNIQKMVGVFLGGSPTVLPKRYQKDSENGGDRHAVKPFKWRADRCLACYRKRVSDWYCYNHYKSHRRNCGKRVYRNRNEWYMTDGIIIEDIDLQTKIASFINNLDWDALSHIYSINKCK